MTGDTVYAILSHGRDAGAGVKNFAADPPPQPVCRFRQHRPVVFASFYPDGDSTFDALATAIDNLRVNEPTVTKTDTSCASLGRGLTLGFSGTLQMEVFQQRLGEEFDTAVLVTPASVNYKYRDRTGVERDLSVENWVHEADTVYLEPIVNAAIITPSEHNAEIIALALRYRGEILDSTTLDEGKRMTMRLRIPLADMVRGFFAELKSISHGYASLEQNDPTYQEADLVKIDVLVNKKKIGALSTIVIAEQSQETATRIVRALKDNLDQAIVDLPIQCYVGSKCIARATVAAHKKDVCWKVHGGDITRKQKLLGIQKKGKALMAKRMIGQASISQETLMAVMGAHKL